MNDYTIRFENKYLQLDQEQSVVVYKKDIVIVEKHLNNEIKINFKKHYLKYTELPEQPKKMIDVKLMALTRRKQSEWKPPINHPWRKQFLWNKLKESKKSKLKN